MTAQGRLQSIPEASFGKRLSSWSTVGAPWTSLMGGELTFVHMVCASLEIYRSTAFLSGDFAENGDDCPPRAGFFKREAFLFELGDLQLGAKRSYHSSPEQGGTHE